MELLSANVIDNHNVQDITQSGHHGICVIVELTTMLLMQTFSQFSKFFPTYKEMNKRLSLNYFLISVVSFDFGHQIEPFAITSPRGMLS